jgi:dihydroneopterin aldolase
MTNSDNIFIEGLKIACHVGTTAAERAFPQPLVIDIELYLDIEKAGQTDDIKYSIDYVSVVESVKKLTAKKKFRLLETVAESIAHELIRSTSAESISVKIKKKIYPAIDSFGVHIQRSK